MKRKVVKVLFSSEVYADLVDCKVLLGCEHTRWLRGFRGDPVGSLQTCVSCGRNHPSLEVLK